jgi:hypothetical protein
LCDAAYVPAVVNRSAMRFSRLTMIASVAVSVYCVDSCRSESAFATS